jgi:hypothetical protein
LTNPFDSSVLRPVRDESYFKALRHRDDGRAWSVRLRPSRDAGKHEMAIALVDADGDPFERVRAFRSRGEAEAEAKRAEGEAIEAGFEPAPPWLEALDRMVMYWREEDPSFDAASLRARALATTKPSAREALEMLENFWALGDDLRSASRAAHDFFEERREAAWPALLLALRHPELGVAGRVAKLVADTSGPLAADGLEALFSMATKRGPRESSAWFEAWRELTRVDAPASDRALDAMPLEAPRLEQLIASNPGCRIFKFTNWDLSSAEPKPKLAVVPAKPRDASFLVECMWVRAIPGERCFTGMFLPERYCEYFYVFRNGRLVKRQYVDEDEWVPLVACEAPGKPWLYECPARPDFGLSVLREGMSHTSVRLGIALDLAPMLEQRGEFEEAIALYKAASKEEPTWGWLRENAERRPGSAS